MQRHKPTTAPRKPATANPFAGKVLVATLSPGTVSTQYARSLATLCLVNPHAAIAGVNTTKTARSWHGRNEAIKVFLESPLDWLLWVDSDMSFMPDAFARLYEAATRDPGVRIAAGLCFMYDADQATVFPNIFDRTPDGHYEPRWQYEPDSRFWCDATGVAFTLIHREVFEKIGYPWHQEWVAHPETGFPMGHDISFYHEAAKHGYRVWYCSDVKIGHVKAWEVTEQAFLQQLGMLGLQPGKADEQSEQA